MVSVSGYPDAFRTADELNTTLKLFTAVLKETGTGIQSQGNHRKVQLSDENDPRLNEQLRSASMGLSLLFVVLPKEKMDIYDRIKTLCDVEFGLATVCAVGSKLCKNQDQYFRNLALKFNLKLGGHNQEVKTQRPSILDEDKTMVVGIDVTHPSPGSSEHAPSVAGMVANIDRRMGQWPAVLTIQSKARSEMGRFHRALLKHLYPYSSKQTISH